MPNDRKPKKKTKKEAMNEIAKVHEEALKKNYVKALSQGYKMALADIIELSADKDFDPIDYCKDQLKLRDGMEEVLDRLGENKETND